MLEKGMDIHIVIFNIILNLILVAGEAGYII